MKILAHHIRSLAFVGFIGIAALPPAVLASPQRASLETAANSNAEALERSYRILHAVLKEADPKTLLIPNFFMVDPPKKLQRLNYTRYSPFNSAADLYGYLVIASYYLDPPLYQGRMLEMLKNEIHYTSAEKSIPGEYSLREQKVGKASLFGAGEYAKDGLISISEVVGESPWHERMSVMMLDLMELAPIPSDFGRLPDKDTELNGDVLQVLPRLFWHSQDTKFLELNRRISDAYFREVLPRNNYLPIMRWNFQEHRGVGAVRLRDHGNETIVGLVLSTIMENLLHSERAKEYEALSRKMIDQVLLSANSDGLLYNEIDPRTLKAVDAELADSWGYIYGAVYNLFLLTGDEKYLQAVLRVLGALPKYKKYTWEGPHYDGFADSIEGAIYLVNRLSRGQETPSKAARETLKTVLPQTEAWIDEEVRHIWAQQTQDGHADRTYLEGNFIRTSMLYGLMKSQGVTATDFQPGLGIGAERRGESLHFLLQPPKNAESNKRRPWSARLRFDSPRHKEFFKLPRNFIRLNEFPEWYTVEREKFYALGPEGRGKSRVLSGEELRQGIDLEAGFWVLQPCTTPTKTPPLKPKGNLSSREKEKPRPSLDSCVQKLPSS